jgi:hypothetical protein
MLGPAVAYSGTAAKDMEETSNADGSKFRCCNPASTSPWVQVFLRSISVTLAKISFLSSVELCPSPATPLTSSEGQRGGVP